MLNGKKYSREKYKLYSEKEEIMMKSIVKYGIVGIAGYLIGFYEMKYKIIKILLSVQPEIKEPK